MSRKCSVVPLCGLALLLCATAAYIYDNRDNRTPVQIYEFADAGAGEAPGASASFPAGPAYPCGAVVA